MPNDKKKLSTQEAENFIKNLESYLQEKWLTKKKLAKMIAPNTGLQPNSMISRLYNLKLKIEQGEPIRYKIVEKIANDLNISVSSLVSEPTFKAVSSESKQFLKEIALKGYSLHTVAHKLKTSENLLREVINEQRGTFNKEQIEKLSKIGIKPHTLAPFAALNVNMTDIIDNGLLNTTKNDWFYKRKGLTRKIFENQISMIDLGRFIEVIEPSLVSPNPYDWKAALKKVGVNKEMEKDLALMGRFKLSSQEVASLRQCEALLRQYTEATVGTHKQLSDEALYKWYVEVKQAVSSNEFGRSGEKIIKFAKTFGSKAVVLLTVGVTSLAKGLPVRAAEIVAEHGVELLEQKKLSYLAEDNNKAALASLVGNHVLKFLLLLSKAISGAIDAPGNVSHPSKLSAFLNLPEDVIMGFISAEGYSAAIVQDWITIWRLMVNGSINTESKIEELREETISTADFAATKVEDSTTIASNPPRLATNPSQFFKPTPLALSTSNNAKPVTLEIPSEYSEYINKAVSKGTISTTDVAANLLLQEQSLNSISFEPPVISSTPKLATNPSQFFTSTLFESAKNYIRKEGESPAPPGYKLVANPLSLYPRLEKLPEDNNVTNISFDSSSGHGRDGHKGGGYNHYDKGGDCIRATICVITKSGSGCSDALYCRSGGGDYTFTSSW